MDKVFSIIIPCFNVEQYIEECLNSIISQTIDLGLLEIILVDDCSTDGTVSILKDYESKYPDSIMLILLEDNGKQGRARNIGMQYASGQYISFIDADDLVRNDMYEILLSVVQKYDVDVVQFRYQIFRNGEVPDYSQDKFSIEESGGYLSVYDYAENRKNYLLNSKILNESCWQKIYKRKMVQKWGLQYAEGVAYEEPLFTYPVKFLVNRVAVLEKRLYFYRENVQGTTLNYLSNPSTIMDHITTQLQLREFIENNDFSKGYELETELYFIHSFYVEPFYFMKRRGWNVPVVLWKYLRDNLISHAPNCINNPYLNDKSLAIDRLLCSLIGIVGNDDEMQKSINDVIDCIELN